MPVDRDAAGDGVAAAGPDRGAGRVPGDAAGAGVEAAAPLEAGAEADGPRPGVVAGVPGTCSGAGGSGTVTEGSGGAAGTGGSPAELTSFCGSTVTAPVGAAVANAQSASSDAAAHPRARRERLDTVLAAVRVRAVALLAQAQQRALGAADEVDLVHET